MGLGVGSAERDELQEYGSKNTCAKNYFICYNFFTLRRFQETHNYEYFKSVCMTF
jgi:hypothetical protein